MLLDSTTLAFDRLVQLSEVLFTTFAGPGEGAGEAELRKKKEVKEKTDSKVTAAKEKSSKVEKVEKPKPKERTPRLGIDTMRCYRHGRDDALAQLGVHAEAVNHWARSQLLDKGSLLVSPCPGYFVPTDRANQN